MLKMPNAIAKVLKLMTDSNRKEEEWVASPCVSICALNDEDVCIGCFRTGNEISGWGRMKVEQKKEVLKRCQVRMAGEDSPCVVNEAKGKARV